MLVIEGRLQANVLGQQHAVTEYVTGHVPYAQYAEVLALYVFAHFPEVTLDGFPGPFGGDPHFFVVVAVGTAGGEGVTNPEVKLL